MRVKLKAAASDHPRARGWLRAGREYLVLAVEAMGAETSAYRIASEVDGTPGLFDSSFFELVDNSIPPLWIAVQEEGVPIQLMPARWAEEGFWEAFFDGESEARKGYEDAVSALGSSGPLPG